MKRRELLGLGAAAVAGTALGPVRRALAQSGRPPTKAAAGRPRITDIELYPAGRVFVRVRTDVGAEGWGEVGVVPARISQSILETYKPLLTGVDPTRIEHIWQMLFRAHRNIRGGVLHAAAIAGIDVALWDLLGRLTDLPVYSLLGGPCRDRILTYPSPKAFKITDHRLHKMVETRAALGGFVHAAEERRKKLGDGGYLMVDGHGKLTAQAAIQVARRIEHLGVLFFEEVVPPEQNEDLVRVKRATTVPLAAGERMATIWPFRPILEARAVDVLNPDIVELGGVSQMHKLAALAEVYDVPLAPHSTHSALGLSASFHVAAAINNFLIHEAYSHIATRAPFLKGLAWADGPHQPLPPGPGLGIKVDLEGMKEAVAMAREKGPRAVEKAYFTGDGAVADR